MPPHVAVAPGLVRRAVRSSDQFEVMPRRVIEVDAPSAVVGVDLARCPTRTGPERHAAGFDALNGAVKHVAGNEQRIVLAGELDAGLGIVEPDPVVERQAENGPQLVCSGSPSRSFRNVADCCLSLAATAKWLK
jgi:hypothetical protein